MGFASAWLRERALFPRFIAEQPHPDTGIIIVVPAYNETGIDRLLDSLAACTMPGCHVELIVVVNAPAGAPPEHLSVNIETEAVVEAGKKSFSSCFSIYCIKPAPLPDWGVGMARKAGMDEALRRFDKLEKPGGVILSLDADCTIRHDYLTAVYNELALRKDRCACSVYFEHPIEGNEFPASNYMAITLYELHLRYYFQALKFTGFPYVFHTVGSAMAVKGVDYMKSGGMNRKQAGEDFYFIQKLVPSGGYFSLNSTVVRPSARTSFRVPFGTGATMERLTREENPVLLTYELRAFTDLRQTFSAINDFREAAEENLKMLYDQLPEAVRTFSDVNEWTSKMLEIRKNTSSASSFRKRFFSWFNMFRIVKYLNYVHSGFYQKLPVENAASQLLETLNIVPGENPCELLGTYRSLEKDQ